MTDSSAPSSRFTSANQSTQERLSSNTVGLVALSDFRKRRAEVLEQQVREARDALTATPDRSQTCTPNIASEGSDAEKAAAVRNKKKKKFTKTTRGNKLSFAGDEEEEEEGSGAGDSEASGPLLKKKQKVLHREAPDSKGKEDVTAKDGAKLGANASVAVVPRAVTKAALRREAAEREALRKEFLALQAAVKATEIAIPFVFYDGTNIPGGIVRIRKGDFIWVFLDKSRKVGARLGVGGERSTNARRDWARVGVDDLMLVRGSLIIPHHYDFYFFIMNKTLGPGNLPLFDYSAEAPPARETNTDGADSASAVPLSTAASKAAELPDIRSLEGASDNPTFTKVVDRRWYERNKHIYPASVWQKFDPEKDYQNEIRRDNGGNAFFYSR